MVDIKILWGQQKQFWSLFVASLIISLNWGIYIWAVNNDHLLQASLGYYINPLISVLFGMIFFKEKLSIATIVAVVIAGIPAVDMIDGDLPEDGIQVTVNGTEGTVEYTSAPAPGP